MSPAASCERALCPPHAATPHVFGRVLPKTKTTKSDWVFGSLFLQVASMPYVITAAVEENAALAFRYISESRSQYHSQTPMRQSGGAFSDASDLPRSNPFQPSHACVALRMAVVSALS